MHTVQHSDTWTTLLQHFRVHRHTALEPQMKRIAGMVGLEADSLVPRADNQTATTDRSRQ